MNTSQDWFAHVMDGCDPAQQMELRFFNKAGEPTYISFNVGCAFDAPGAFEVMQDLLVDGLVGVCQAYACTHEELFADSTEPQA